MKRLLPFLLVIGLLSASCYKDDADVAALTTNPLDPDYTGPALIELVSDTTQVLFNVQMQPLDTVVRQVIHVRTDLLPSGTSYELYITKINSGEIIDYTSDIPQVEEQYRHVTPGTNYCYDYQLKVQYSLTKAYRYCTTAAL